MNRLLEDLGEQLQAPMRAFRLEWELAQTLERRMRPVRRMGLGALSAIDYLKPGRPGHELAIGIQLYELDDDDTTYRLAHVVPPYHLRHLGFWAVPQADYRRFYRTVRRCVRESCQASTEPFLAPEDRRRLWDNTIGFLRRGPSALKQFGVPSKRGVLLTGEPGNGKTTACRWLSAQCQRHGFESDSVTRQEYDTALSDGDVHELFQTSRPGIIVFDDFDAALRRRGCHDESRDQNTFLTNLDGVHARTGVVYVFTSNLAVEDIDPALRRPGRLDLVIHFRKPSLDQRSRYIQSRWQSEITVGLDVARVALETESRSFAELEELRKLLVFRYLDTGRIDWDWACATFDGRCDAALPGRRIGFAPILDAAGRSVEASSPVAARLPR